ncbi:MAG TPA: HEPN domain-containing protein [Solirubrobacterales bacterium]
MSTAPDLPGDLLALAREDLAAAEALDRAERVSDAPVGFHAQQAVEKALKAVIARRDTDFPFTHDIGLLMQLCQDAGLELPADLAEADRLTPYAAAIRYGLGDPRAVPIRDALRWAALAIEWADAQLRSDS